MFVFENKLDINVTYGQQKLALEETTRLIPQAHRDMFLAVLVQRVHQSANTDVGTKNQDVRGNIRYIQLNMFEPLSESLVQSNRQLAEYS